ncbi:isoprenoid synthase domain-containing protein [Xylariaceae sp. FL1272]|nr:isoprenoid synthase domain-containing protein [Xylariaceae sp. FL1272]
MLPWKTTASWTDLVIWFGMWDDLVEKLGDDTTAAENLRMATKDFVRSSFGLADRDVSHQTNPWISSFRPIADGVCAFYDMDQRKILLAHFDQYIDATRLEAQAEQSTNIPSLKEYWEVRILASGMGTLLGLSELAVQAHLPVDFVKSEAYSTLWKTTVVINSIINDLLSFKKEMKAKSVLSSVAILFHQYGDLDTAVDMSLHHTRQMVELFDRTADDVLSKPELNDKDRDAISKIVDLMRTVNTGNLTWSLQAKRYGVAEYMKESGDIELVL